jgi:hypothetical protein
MLLIKERIEGNYLETSSRGIRRGILISEKTKHENIRIQNQ